MESRKVKKSFVLVTYYKAVMKTGFKIATKSTFPIDTY